MRDYYDILNIPRDAAPLEIKKAYFSLVRKYSPERYPEVFKEIREAYEILIDEKTRKEYSSISQMTPVVKQYYDLSKETLEIGDAEEAIRLLERVNKVYPDLTMIKSLLADAYLENGNSVKAIQILEELTENEPDNAGYAGKLAQGYLDRDWHRKAVDKYKKALKLDKDNFVSWLGLIDSYLKGKDYTKSRKTIEEALSYKNTKDWDNTIFYFRFFEIDIIEKNFDRLKVHLEEAKLYALQGDEFQKETMAWMLSYISSILEKLGYQDDAFYFINTAHEIDPDNKDISEDLARSEKDVFLSSLLEKMMNDNTIHDNIKNLLEFVILDKCKNKICIECELEEFMKELYIVEDQSAHKSSILKLKNGYPELYDIKKEFFSKVLNPAMYRKMMYQYKKKLEGYIRTIPEKFLGVKDYYSYDDDDDENYDYDDDYDDDDDDDYDYDDQYKQEPYKRSEPKVGRNDPCPCGSGKKHKKCCGK